MMFERKNRILLKELVKTDFKLRYQGSIMGYVWSVLKPLMLFTVMYVVFVRFLKFGQDVPHFEVALLLGTVLWSFFSETTNLGMSSIVTRGDLLRKLSFPTHIIVVAVSINALINLVISLVIVLLFAMINGADISIYAFLAPLLLIELYAFSLGVSFILATIYVRFRDIGPIWEVVLQAGFYLTPLIYPLTLVMNMDVNIAKLLMMNPMAQIIQDMRHILTSTSNITVWQLINTNWIVAIPYVLPWIVLVAGYMIFNKNSKKFAEII
ncbi:ABC transporter permease [Enterococcus casseliflavus]|uniref:Transport permease protein n=1 Tax=Enterococcus casseliflavus TaxID=37734 RepID=A0A415ETF4_ENTCA|nr:ABC transporter permease [Enterococcus casseliflavus]MBE6170060.1 ABC transporter permease [Enterococcus casseliflavus]MBE9909291.1 ABC transporter permease [Enterococcus casseliflavus]MBX9116146.1 ABC transporter permease [Enterococcus casseliflavus]MBX9125154.1 ABC transporter permease [Enterococcus casseliflavus]NKD29542.1 ABC transporter permease [Enterococcus casseliflavus]